MAFVHGKSIYVSVATHDISAYTNKADFPRNADTAETSCFGTTDKTHIPGLKGATFSIEGLWDATLDGYLDAVFGTEVAVVYRPAGTGGGLIQYAFQAIMTSYNPPGSIGDAVKYSAAFTITGAPVRTIQ